MELTELFKILIALFPFGYIKIGIMMIMLIYIIFAFVIIQQVNLMSKVVETPFSAMLRIMSVVHFLMVFAVFFLSVVAI